MELGVALGQVLFCRTLQGEDEWRSVQQELTRKSWSRIVGPQELKQQKGNGKVGLYFPEILRAVLRGGNEKGYHQAMTLADKAKWAKASSNQIRDSEERALGQGALQTPFAYC